MCVLLFFFFFQAEDGIRDKLVTGVQTCALPIFGKSTCGSGDTGSWKNAIAPARVMPKVSSVVATGRRMKDSDTLIAASSWAARSWRRALFAFPLLVFAGEVRRQTI